MNIFISEFLPALSASSLLGVVAEKTSLLESQGFILVGFLLVLIVLFLLYMICLGLGFVFVRYERQQKKSAAAAATQSAAAAPPPADDVSEDQRIAAVIAAAVHVALGSRARVVRIQLGFSDEWAREGRRRHFASHKLR